MIVFGWNPGFEVSSCRTLKKGFGNISNPKVCIWEAAFAITHLIIQAPKDCLTQGHSLLWLSQKELIWGTDDLGSNAVLGGQVIHHPKPHFPYLKIRWLEWTMSMSLSNCNILSGILNSALPPTVCPRGFAHYS